MHHLELPEPVFCSEELSFLSYKKLKQKPNLQFCIGKLNFSHFCWMLRIVQECNHMWVTSLGFQIVGSRETHFFCKIFRQKKLEDFSTKKLPQCADAKADGAANLCWQSLAWWILTEDHKKKCCCYCLLVQWAVGFGYAPVRDKRCTTFTLHAIYCRFCWNLLKYWRRSKGRSI